MCPRHCRYAEARMLGRAISFKIRWNCKPITWSATGVHISILLIVLKSLGTLSTSGWRSFRPLDFVLRAFGTTADIRRQGHQWGWRIFSCRLTILSGNANGIGLCEVYPEYCMWGGQVPKEITVFSPGPGWSWLVLAFDCIRWFSIVFNGIQWYSMVFNGLGWSRMVSDGLGWSVSVDLDYHRMV